MTDNMDSVILTESVFAMVNGAPFNQLPDDLYIPPDALEVFESRVGG